MYENKLNLTDIDLLIEESKKINFSSEPEIRNLVRKYPMNFKGVGILNENSLIEYLKTDENYKKSKEIDSITSLYKTLLIKRKIHCTDLGKGMVLKNLPGWKVIKDNNIYHKSHIIARELGGKRIYHSSGEYYNGFIGTKHANVGRNGKSGMRYIERIIQKHLCENENNYIVYECRVIYKRPKDIIPIFIVIIIVSGDYSINKIYFVWNTQDGYIIDYKTGNYLPYDKNTSLEELIFF
ncbi:hypothetical protein [Gemella sanguinis]|jgi:hypothetical protein|uniref:hypothetical protein n=1 Tax=Gemella sanguinis TaxID=84135 RepID=UPI0028E5AD90|nr:hypothetical protein [Gemella sanguinis]